MVTELGRLTRPYVVSPREKEVLFENKFNHLEGLGGWGGLIASSQANFYPYLGAEGAVGGYSMILDTQGGSTSRTATAIRRMTRRDGMIEWKSRIAWTADNANFLRYLRFIMDYENETDRYWFDLRYRYFDEAVSSIEPLWQVNTGNASVFVYANTSVTFEVPYNQRQKLNWTDLTVRFDTQNKTYGPLTINGVSYSLGNLATSSSPKLAEPETYFTNGMNLLYYAEGRSNNSSADPRLYVGYTAGAVV